MMDKCLGQDSCEDCPRYLDDCDGKEEEVKNENITTNGKKGGKK
jgi:hypothetical protein